MAKLKVYVSRKGNFNRSRNYLKKIAHKDLVSVLTKYAQMGVDALREATPKDTGHTADSWYSEIEIGEYGMTIYWKNSYINEGYPIAILIDIGHGTGTGGYVAPYPYIEPALNPVIEQIQETIRKEVASDG